MNGRPGEGQRVGNIEIAPGRGIEGEMTFFFGDESAVASPGTFVPVSPARMLNIHAPADFDRRIGLPD